MAIIEIEGIFHNTKSSESLSELFRNYGILQEFKKDSFIFMKGEMPRAVYLIEKGYVKICQLTSNGQSVTFFIRKPGEAFGLAEIILNHNHPCYAQCLYDSQVWVLNANVIKKKIDSDIGINKEILSLMTSRLIYQQSIVELLTSQSVEGRLALLLKQLSTPGSNGEQFIDMILTHEEIGNIIGCSRQTVTEILNRWRSQGKIKYNRKKLVICNINNFLS